MLVRFAKEEDLEQVNRLRGQVSDLHSAGRPDIFQPHFTQEMRDFLYTYWEEPEYEIVVCELDGEIVGMAILRYINKPENPSKLAQERLDIDEFGVDEAHHRMGIATQMIEFIKDYAREKGLNKIELNMWEFNTGALAFYEAVGFETYRRYMELFV